MLAVKERTMVLMAVGTGLKRGELFALKWKDVDFDAKQASVTRSIVSQVVGICKTEASQKPIPLHESLAQALLEWRRHTSFRKREDWVFASPHSQGSDELPERTQSHHATSTLGPWQFVPIPSHLQARTSIQRLKHSRMLHKPSIQLRV